MSAVSQAIDNYVSKEGADRFSLPALHKKLIDIPDWGRLVKPLEQLGLPERHALSHELIQSKMGIRPEIR